MHNTEQKQDVKSRSIGRFKNPSLLVYHLSRTLSSSLFLSLSLSLSLVVIHWATWEVSVSGIKHHPLSTKKNRVIDRHVPIYMFSRYYSCVRWSTPDASSLKLAPIFRVTFLARLHIETRGKANSTRVGERTHAVPPTDPGYEYAFSTVKYVQIASWYSPRPFIIVASSYSPPFLARRTRTPHTPKLLIRVNCNHQCSLRSLVYVHARSLNCRLGKRFICMEF